MAVIKDPKSGFDFAYKGYQYPLPPSWKYAIRQQDQINWLLQAILMVSAEGVSVDEMNDAVMGATDYASRLNALVNSRIDALNKGWFTARNPVTGMYDFGYVILKQMYDMLRVYACTWDELKATGKTWDELKADGLSWFEVDMFGNLYYGDGSIRAKYTPQDHIDWLTPGFDYSCWPWPLNPDTPTPDPGPSPDPGPGPDPGPDPEPVPEPGENLKTWDSLKVYGFLLGDESGEQTGRTWDDLQFHGFKYYVGSELVQGTTWDAIKQNGFAVS